MDGARQESARAEAYFVRELRASCEKMGVLKAQGLEALVVRAEPMRRPQAG
jgi:hypothetical protein